MTENYNLAGNVPSTGSVCTGTGDVGVGLDTPVEKLHVKLQGADISCSTYTGTIGVGGGVWAQAAWLGGYLNNNNLGFANCSCDTNPLTLDCQVYNSGGTLLNYPIPISPYQGPAIPGYSPYYIYMPSPMPANNNCVDQYSVAGNAKYYRWSRENYAETYDDLEVNAVPYTGLITSCTTGEATFRVDNSGLLFAPGMLIFTGGTATTTGTVVTTGVVTGSLHLSGDIYGYWRTIAGPLNDLTNVVSCSCDSGGSTRDCPVLDSGFNALQTAPYVAPTANFAAGVGIILN